MEGNLLVVYLDAMLTISSLLVMDHDLNCIIVSISISGAHCYAVLSCTEWRFFGRQVVDFHFVL